MSLIPRGRRPSRMAPLLRASRRSEPNDAVPTPMRLFTELDREFGFTLDVCASAENAKCRRYYTTEQNGLEQAWEGVCWCNPPYSAIGPWAERAYYEAKAGRATVVMLLPVWSDRRWWHRWALRATEIRFIEGRVDFRVGPARGRNGNPYAMCLVVWLAGLPV